MREAVCPAIFLKKFPSSPPTVIAYLPSVQILSELFRFLSFKTHLNLNVEILQISGEIEYQTKLQLLMTFYQ